MSSDVLAVPLPDGVVKSEWTELNVDLLGSAKRIIQIETHFSEPPYIIQSFACPNTTALQSCDRTQFNVTTSDPMDGIVLETNVTYFFSQVANTYQSFQYSIKGDACATSVKVGDCVGIICDDF